MLVTPRGPARPRLASDRVMLNHRVMRDSTQHISTEQRESLTEAELLAVIDAGWFDAPPAQKRDKPKKKRSGKRSR